MNQELSLISNEMPTLIQLALVNMPAGSQTDDAQRVVMREIANLENQIMVNPTLKNCAKASFVFAIKEAINNNLTLSPSAGLVYLLPTQVIVGTGPANEEIKEWRVMYTPTANGLLSMARQSGRILDNKRPSVKYDGAGKVCEVSVEFLVPSFPQPRWEIVTFNNNHFTKWKNASAKKNRGNANANYSSWNEWIDPEFAGTKAIKHGLKKLGINMNEGRRNPELANQFVPQPATAAIAEATEDVSHEELGPFAKDIQRIQEKHINPEDL